MSNISLIANTGIQFHKFEIKIDTRTRIIQPIGFYEYESDNKQNIFLEYAYYLPEQSIWVQKKLLKELEYLDANDKLTANINSEVVSSFAITDSPNFYTIGSITECLRAIFKNTDENIWLPIPYFQQNSNQKSIFGPFAWARMLLKDISEKNAVIKTYKVVLAFDTKIDDISPVFYTPRTGNTKSPGNHFALSNNEDHNLDFCNAAFNCGWVDTYLRNVIENGKEREEFPYLKYLAYYLYLLKAIETLNVLPEVTLFSDNTTPINVDLVLDMGNSNTCGLLFESPSDNSAFKFTSVKKLKLNDLSDAQKDYDEPFSMRLAFSEAKFGDIDIPGYENFRWPSLVRLGKEAGRLINKSALRNTSGIETATNHSSPKRYLWDDKKTDIPWEFINYILSEYKRPVYYEGITEQFKTNGDYAYDGENDVYPNYSKKSLMTFVYIEIILHAISQINSIEFRDAHGKPGVPRKLKRITITCPTSIVQKEQVLLRECASEAVLAISRFYSNTWDGKYNKSIHKNEIEILPNPKDLSLDLSQISFRKDWNFDESTCCQLVFLYAELSKRYLNNAELFFDLFGKKRNDVSNPDQKSLTIGSIDIGGGTTDLMICAYQYKAGQAMAVVEPLPLYWESFNLAGDDLLKEIVQQIILEGTLVNNEDENCIGVIENTARKAGIKDIKERMLNFFGTDAASQSYLQRIYRKNFIVQVAIPIALRYIQHSIDDLPDFEIGYNDIFLESKPNPELINYFNNHFSPIKFENIKWKLSKSRVNSIIETTFDASFKQLSAILSAYGCDFVLLAGKPTTIPKIREILIKYYPVSPERIITLNNYRVGRWYPFADDFGYIKDPKTIVAVGALIALMGDKLGKLDGFNLKTDLLKENVTSTSEYIGLLKRYTQEIDSVILSPEINEYIIEIDSLPMTLGYKQLPNKKYKGRPIYKLDFNDVEIRRFIAEQNPTLKDEIEIADRLDDKKNKLKNALSYKISLNRNWHQSHEKIEIIQIEDKNNNTVPNRFLSLKIMTLPDENGYWLDTGEFVLNIN